MGVRSLWRLLQAARTPPWALGAPLSRQVAVDIAGLLHMHYSVQSREDVIGYHASSALYIIVEILEAGWRPVFVFDSGRPSWLKKAELQRRHAAQQERCVADDEEVQKELELLQEKAVMGVGGVKEGHTTAQQNILSKTISNTPLEEIHALHDEIQAEVASLAIGGQNPEADNDYIDILSLDRELTLAASMHQEKFLHNVSLRELWNPLVHQKREYARNMLKTALKEAEVTRTQKDLLLLDPIPWLTPYTEAEGPMAGVQVDGLQDNSPSIISPPNKESDESEGNTFDLFNDYYEGEVRTQMLANLDRLSAHNAIALAKECQVRMEEYLEPTSIDIHPSTFFNASGHSQLSPFETSTSTFLKFVNYQLGTKKYCIERPQEAFLNEKIRQEVAAIAQLFQIPSLCSKPGIESEQVCATLCKEGYTFATVTNDSDAFLFGTPLILRREAGVKKLVAYTQDTWKRYFSVADITFLAFLLGCDFCPGVLGYGPVSAVETLLYVKYLLHPPSWLGLKAPAPHLELMELIINFKAYYVNGDIPIALKANSRQMAERYINTHYVLPYPELELPPDFSSKELARIREELCLRLRQTRQASLRLYSTGPEASFTTFSKDWNHIITMVHKEGKVREMCIPILEGEALPDRILASLETPVSGWDPVSPILASPARLERLATLTSLSEEKVRQLLTTALAGFTAHSSSLSDSVALDSEAKPEPSRRLAQALFALAIFTSISGATIKSSSRRVVEKRADSQGG